jgi:hypothetical protein
MPATVLFSVLALLYVVAMATYHGFFLVTRFVLPEPAERAARGWSSVLTELFLTLAVLAPVLRRIVPVLTWVRGPSAVSAALFYVAAFAWLPALKGAAMIGLPHGPRKDHAMRVLYSVPLSVVYVMGIGYLLFVTVSMMVTL